MSTGEREIVPQEAAVVDRIFRDYERGISPKEIATHLNQERVPGPNGCAWSPSTIHGHARRGTGILNNELYVGRLVWNRQRYVKDPDTGKRLARPNPASEWITTDVPALRIIDDGLWNSAKARQRSSRDLAAAARPPLHTFRRPKYLFSGVTKCAACGGGYVVLWKETLGCFNARSRGTWQAVPGAPCAGTNAEGLACRRLAAVGSNLCTLHQATQEPAPAPKPVDKPTPMTWWMARNIVTFLVQQGAIERPVAETSFAAAKIPEIRSGFVISGAIPGAQVGSEPLAPTTLRLIESSLGHLPEARRVLERDDPEWIAGFDAGTLDDFEYAGGVLISELRRRRAERATPPPAPVPPIQKDDSIDDDGFEIDIDAIDPEALVLLDQNARTYEGE